MRASSWVRGRRSGAAALRLACFASRGAARRVVVVEADVAGVEVADAGSCGVEEREGVFGLVAFRQDRAEDLRGAGIAGIRVEDLTAEAFAGREVASLMSVDRKDQQLIERGSQQLAPS